MFKDQAYIADTSIHRIRRIGRGGQIELIAGAGKFEHTGDEIPAVKSELASPFSMALDREGNIYIADSGSRRVSKIDRNGIIHTISGGIKSTNLRPDGVLGIRSCVFPEGIAVDAAGNM